MFKDLNPKYKYTDRTQLKLKMDSFSLELSPQGRGLFFNQTNGEILSLNKTSAFIVRQLSEQITFGELMEIFKQEFSIPLDLAVKHLKEFLEDLRSYDLIEETED